MKTNSKQFKTAVENYLLDQLQGYDESETIEQKLLDVVAEYNNAKDHRGSTIGNFIYFLDGGSSTISTPISNYEIREDYTLIFKNAGFEVVEVKERLWKMNDNRVRELYYTFLLRAFKDLCEKHKIIFN